MTYPVVFLIDVDNTLLDNDRVHEDLEKAERYVFVDDKRGILSAVKQYWRERVTTVFARQGSYARDPTIDDLAQADLTIEHIADLLDEKLLQSSLTIPIPASKAGGGRRNLVR